MCSFFFYWLHITSASYPNMVISLRYLWLWAQKLHPSAFQTFSLQGWGNQSILFQLEDSWLRIYLTYQSCKDGLPDKKLLFLNIKLECVPLNVDVCLWQQDKNSEAPVRIKKSTGIPRSFMVEVDDPNIKGAKLTNCGRYAIPAIDAWVLIKVLLCVFINVSFVWPLGNTFIYTFLRVCLQKCIYYPWHRLNQVLETFLRDLSTLTWQHHIRLQISRLHFHDVNLLFDHMPEVFYWIVWAHCHG